MLINYQTHNGYHPGKTDHKTANYGGVEFFFYELIAIFT